MIERENDFVELITQFLLNNKYKVWKEVPNMGQSADIVATKNKSILVIEAKLKNWTKAIQQCQAHEVVADFIYIAIATHEISQRLFLEAEHKGYGIIHFDRNKNTCIYKLKAKRNTEVWKPQRAILASNLNRIEYAS